MRRLIQEALHVAILLLCTCSCHNKPYPKSMQAADYIVNTVPDSAVVLLEQLKDSISSEPQSTQIYYYLLSTKAKDKAYIPHTSDSLILQVVHYYENKKDKKHLPEAYYYAGRICRDLGDAPQALDYFQKAIEVLEESNKYRLLSRIYSQMGTLYMYQDIYDEAMDSYKKAYQYDILAKDSIEIALSLRDIGFIFTGQDNPDSALYYYKSTYKLAEQLGNKSLMDETQSLLAGLYIQLKDYDSAKQAMNSLSSTQTNNLTTVYSILAKLHYQTGQIDSAYYFLNHLINIGTIYAKQTSHLSLAEIAIKRNDCQSTMDHVRKYASYTDSIQKSTNIESIRKLQSLYNYQLREKENHQLQTKNAKQKLLITHISLVISILIAFCLIYIQHSKRKKRDLKEKLSKLEKLKEELYHKSNKFIEANKIKIQELEAQLQDKTNKNSILQELIQIQKKQIMQINCKIATDQKEQELAERSFRQSEIYNHFHKAIKDENIKISKHDWQSLQSQIDCYCKQFTSRLQSIYPMSDIELQICLLLKTDISTTGIAQLTGRSKSAIVSARKKLYEKVHGEKGKPEQWDAFIASL